ncbi:hypothetical protein [Novosphingobium sp. Gsoil 351]|uniref:hypothetical protein n=1 Tax=Novosphingobium sp. Gsoil 351 TaxID=2675225 RepID=UPI0012B47712|nr:hypothetical protein [Novosphingobium sp. Gsoil 351]QGN53333.1 hypothetical protein GKE62_00970 [Novosphingobium sp. Gsoil 351]
MEYEIEDVQEALWLVENGHELGPNHMPGWFRDSAGAAQTGEWIPEEATPPLARALEPAS